MDRFYDLPFGIEVTIIDCGPSEKFQLLSYRREDHPTLTSHTFDCGRRLIYMDVHHKGSRLVWKMWE